MLIDKKYKCRECGSTNINKNGYNCYGSSILLPRL